MKRKNPFNVQILSSGETPSSTNLLPLSSETKLAFQEIINLARITRNRLLKQGYAIIENQVIDPNGRVIYENYKQ